MQIRDLDKVFQMTHLFDEITLKMSQRGFS